MVKKAVSYRIDEKVLEEFNKVSDREALNKSKWIENKMKEYNNENNSKIVDEALNIDSSSFDSCEKCGTPAKIRNVGKESWCYCEQCKIKWNFGFNVVSSWKYEDEKIWKENFEFLKNYKEV